MSLQVFRHSLLSSLRFNHAWYVDRSVERAFAGELKDRKLQLRCIEGSNILICRVEMYQMTRKQHFERSLTGSHNNRMHLYSFGPGRYPGGKQLLGALLS